MAHIHGHDDDVVETDGTPAGGRRLVERHEAVAPSTEVYEERVAAPSYDEVVSDRRGFWYADSLTGRVDAILGVLLVALEGLLALRFALVAFGANRSSGFVDFVLDVSWPFVRPFSGAFANRTWDEGVIEVSTLLAMGVWALVFLLAGMLIHALLPDVRASGVTHRRRVTHI